MIPESWRVLPFNEVAEYCSGRTPARANSAYWGQASGSIPWVSIADMSQLATVNSTKEYISRRAFDEVFRRKAVPAGTLLMSYKLTVGRVSQLGMDACHNEAIISIRPKPGVDQAYLGFFLSQYDFEQLQDRQVKGNTLNQEKIDRIAVLLPPIDEQIGISNSLRLVRRAMEVEDRLLTASEELKRAVMFDVFTRGLRGEAQKETEIGPVPSSWNVVPLGSIGRIGNGSTPKKSVPDYWTNGTFPWLTSAKVYDREIRQADQFVTETALRECHLPKVEPGAILMAITGQGKTLGHCAVLRIQATINQHIAYVATDEARANPSFVRGYLETQYDFLRKVGSGGGSTKGALTCAFLRTMQIPLPSTIAEQQEVVKLLDQVDRKIELHKRKRVVLGDLFNSLLHKLMTGEIRVGDLDLSVLRDITSASPANTSI